MMSVRPSRFVLKVFPRALLAVVAVVALAPAAATVWGNADIAATLGGDFPSFYAAGEIVLDGRIDELYDPVVQTAYQEAYQADDAGLLYFAYPPVTAIVYAGIAWLPYGVAASVHALLALVSIVLAMWLIVPRIDEELSRIDHVVLASAGVLIIMPMIVSVLGGQNTAFTLLLLALVWHFIWKGAWVWAGVATAAMLYKPQYGLLVLAAVLVARRWRLAAVAIAGAFVIYLGSALVLGPAWPIDWIDQVRWFAERNADVNAALFVNISGWAGAALSNDRVALMATAIAIIAVAGVSATFVFKRNLSWQMFGLVGAAVLLLSPSSLFYDAAIAIVGFGLYVVTDRVPWPWIGVVVAASWSQLVADSLGWSPLFVIVVAVWLLYIRVLPKSVSQAPGTLAAPVRHEQRRDTWRAMKSS